MDDDIDGELLQLALGPEFDNAPAWGRALAVQLARLAARQARTNKALGHEPDSDGKGGEGLIGDLRKTMRNVDQLLDLKKMGVGAIAAITLFGALILLGVVNFIHSVSGAAK